MTSSAASEIKQAEEMIKRVIGIGATQNESALIAGLRKQVHAETLHPNYICSRIFQYSQSGKQFS